MAFGKKKAGGVEPPVKIRINQTTYQRAILKKLIVQFLLVVMALVVVYVLFAALLFRAVPTSDGFILIKNNSYSGGRIPAGETVLISTTTDIGDTQSDHLAHAFFPQSDTALVQVLAGPSGAVKWSKNGTITVNKKPLPIEFPEDPKLGILEYEYIAVCVQGACNPGEPIIFSQKRIYGVPIQKTELKGANFEGLKDTLKNDAGRPSAADISVWVKGTNPKFSEERATCAAELYRKSELSNEALTHFIQQVIQGERPEVNPDDQAIINAVNSSEEMKSCTTIDKRGN